VLLTNNSQLQFQKSITKALDFEKINCQNKKDKQ